MGNVGALSQLDLRTHRGMSMTDPLTSGWRRHCDGALGGRGSSPSILGPLNDQARLCRDASGRASRRRLLRRRRQPDAAPTRAPQRLRAPQPSRGACEHRGSAAVFAPASGGHPPSRAPPALASTAAPVGGPAPHPCCRAFTTQGLACSVGQTKAEYCAEHHRPHACAEELARQHPRRLHALTARRSPWSARRAPPVRRRWIITSITLRPMVEYCSESPDFEDCEAQTEALIVPPLLNRRHCGTPRRSSLAPSRSHTVANHHCKQWPLHKTWARRY